MKKYFFAITLCSLVFAACNKEQTEPVKDEPKGEKVTLRAVGEEFEGTDLSGSTKGTLNAAGNFFWATGDQIGVRLYKGTAWNGTDGGSGYGAWDGTFLLDDGYEGKQGGSFTSTTSLDEWVHWGYAAFYPKFSNNISNDNGNVYFELKKVYEGYVSGTCLMPMVANMNNVGTGGIEGRPETISFKHVGAGVRVTLKDVPASANQASLTVAGKNIVNGDSNDAWYGVNPANAGTDAITATDGDDNTVYLKFATAAEKRDITFIFPLPTVDLSGGITLKLYYGGSYTEFWSATCHPVAPATPLPALTRGQVLDMPDITVPVSPDGTVTLYFRAATPVTTKACLCSSVLGTEGWPGTEMTETETIAGSTWYKFEAPASKVWDKSVNFYFHGGGWASSETYGDFSSTHKMAYYFVAESGKTVRQLSSRPKDWDFSSYAVDWSGVDSSVAGRTDADYDAIQLMKATANASKVFVYFEVKKSGLYDEPTYQYANLLKMYLGDASSSTAFDWQWTSKYTVKFNSWLQKDAVPDLVTYECSGYQSHVEKHTQPFADNDVDILYYEMTIPRSFNACLQGTSATIAIEANKQYVLGDWAGYETQIGFAPNNWGPTYAFTLPTYVAE